MKIDRGVSRNVDLVGYHDLENRPGFQMAMHVVNDMWYLYLGHFWHKGWTIMDVTDPSKPELLRFVPWPGSENTITIKVQVAEGLLIANLQREIALLAREGAPFEEGILIFDLKDPVNPRQLGHWKTGSLGTHRNFYNGGRYVHCAAAAPGFTNNIYRIVDIADPAHPVEAGRWWLPEQWAAGGAKTTRERVDLHGPPYVVGNRAYLSYMGGGMVILDISDISVPKLISQLQFQPPFGRSIACHTVLPLPRRGLAIASSEGIGIQPTGRHFATEKRAGVDLAGIVDISDETNPVLISTFPVPEPPPGSPYRNFHEKGGWFGPHNWHEPHDDPNLEDRDDRVYLTYFNAGLRVFDISDPLLPKEIAYYIPPDPKERYGPMPFGKLVVSSEDILVDRRGYIYMTDKNLGLHVLRCTI